MKKLIAIVLAATLWPLPPAFASTNLDPNQCSSLQIATTNTGTQIFAQDPAATASWIVNVSTNTVYFVGGSTTSASGVAAAAAFSISLTTGSFRLPGVAANVQPLIWTLDSPNSPYTGPLWGVAASDGAAMTILRCRTH